MAAGLGFKTFTTGEVLTAGDVNGYLMQGINVFATTAARDAAITAPAEGQFAFTKDTNGLWYYDGAAWVASGATGDIEGVTAGVGISGGGTSGTVTVTNSMATAIDAKGDLVPGTGADTFARLAVGANNTVLTADSSTATGLKWAAVSASPASSGARVSSFQTTTSTSYTDLATSGPAVTLTTGTKVLIIVSANASNGSGVSLTDFDVSGATTRAATDDTCLLVPSGVNIAASQATFLTVTAGSNTFTAKYRTNTSTSTFGNRGITVIDLGS